MLLQFAKMDGDREGQELIERLSAAFRERCTPAPLTNVDAQPAAVQAPGFFRGAITLGAASATADVASLHGASGVQVPRDPTALPEHRRPGR